MILQDGFEKQVKTHIDFLMKNVDMDSGEYEFLLEFEDCTIEVKVEQEFSYETGATSPGYVSEELTSRTIISSRITGWDEDGNSINIPLSVQYIINQNLK